MTREKRKKLSGAAAHSPTSEWMVLLQSGLTSVRSIVMAGYKQPDERKQRVFEALKIIGLFNFMRTVFKWQKVDICSQFVLNWNRDERKSFVNDVEIDASVETFVMVTGLLAEESAMASDEAKGDRSETCGEKIWRRKEGQNSCSLDEFKDLWVRDLLILLSRTVWMRITNHPKQVPFDLAESVSEALSGKKLRWSKTLYIKFICEMRRLQTLSLARQKEIAEGSFRVLETVAGPVMCFLYIHAKLKAEAFAELKGPSLRGKDELTKESVDNHHEEESLPREDVPKSEESLPREEVTKSEVADEDYSKQYQVSSMPSNLPDFAVKQSDYLTRKRKLFDQDKGSASVRNSATIEALEAKVLELECVIARQSAELAECRLLLYTKRSISS